MEHHTKQPVGSELLELGLFTRHVLSVAEFTSLERIASRRPPAKPISSEHLLKLVGLRYIEAVHGRYEATTQGRFRMASKS